MDRTEPFRRHAVNVINSEIESEDEELERKRLEAKYGKVYNSKEVGVEFEITGFMAPYAACVNRHTKEEGLLEFQDYPRFYFNFRSA